MIPLNFRRLALLVLGLMLALPAEGQNRINVEARFVDELTGAPVPGVEVEIENEDTGAVRSYTVDAWGRLRVFGLPAGSYVLRVTDPGPGHDFPEPNEFRFNESVQLEVQMPADGVVVSGPGNSGGEPDDGTTMQGIWIQWNQPPAPAAYQGYTKSGRWWRCPPAGMAPQTYPLQGPPLMEGPVCVFFLGSIPDGFSITFAHPGVSYQGIESVAGTWTATSNGNGTVTAELDGALIGHDGGPVFQVQYRKTTAGKSPLEIVTSTQVGITEWKDGTLIPLPTVVPDVVRRPFDPALLREPPPRPPRGQRRNR